MVIQMPNMWKNKTPYLAVISQWNKCLTSHVTFPFHCTLLSFFFMPSFHQCVQKRGARRQKEINILNKINVLTDKFNTGCPRRNGQNFGRVFLMLKYTDITQNTYIQSWTVTEIMAREVWKFDSCHTLTDYQIHIKTDSNMWFL